MPKLIRPGVIRNNRKRRSRIRRRMIRKPVRIRQSPIRRRQTTKTPLKKTPQEIAPTKRTRSRPASRGPIPATTTNQNRRTAIPTTRTLTAKTPTTRTTRLPGTRTTPKSPEGRGTPTIRKTPLRSRKATVPKSHPNLTILNPAIRIPATPNRHRKATSRIPTTRKTAGTRGATTNPRQMRIKKPVRKANRETTKKQAMDPILRRRAMLPRITPARRTTRVRSKGPTRKVTTRNRGILRRETNPKPPATSPVPISPVPTTSPPPIRKTRNKGAPARNRPNPTPRRILRTARKATDRPTRRTSRKGTSSREKEAAINPKKPAVIPRKLVTMRIPLATRNRPTTLPTRKRKKPMEPSRARQRATKTEIRRPPKRKMT